MSAPLTWTDSPESTRRSLTPWEFCVAVLEPLASLKLTVVLFAMAIFIIFAGTLAQVDHDIWDVIRHLLSGADRVDSSRTSSSRRRFSRRRFGPRFQSRLAIPFPGGWMIGAVMALNLVSAHLVRFQVQARGLRLSQSVCCVIAVGVVLTWLVIAVRLEQGRSAADAGISYDTLWNLFLSSLSASVAAGTGLPDAF